MRSLSVYILVIIIAHVGCQNNVCQINTPDVSIKIDTINMEITGIPLSIMKHANKYYLLCTKIEIDTNDRIIPIYYYSDCHFVISDRDGNITYRSKNIDVYHEDLDIYIKNDSIIIAYVFYNKMLYYNPNSLATWEIIDPVELSRYEDEKYKIFTPNVQYLYDNTVYFKNTTKSFTNEGPMGQISAINKMNGKYYLTYCIYKNRHFFSYVIVIPDPEKLPSQNLTQQEKIMVIQQATDTLLYPVPYPISYSFVHKDQLLHIYSDKENTYIAKVKDKKLCNVFTFNNRIHLSNAQQASDKYQIMLFKTMDNNSYGYIEATPKELYIHYINPASNNEKTPSY